MNPVQTVLLRWRERAQIRTATIAALCGMAPEEYAAKETRQTYADPADRLALELLFGERFSVKVLLQRCEGEPDHNLMCALDDAFRAAMLNWRRAA